MSIYKLKNKTGLESYQEWANKKTFPNDVSVDLINPEDEVGICSEDFIGVENGQFHDELSNLIRTGLWVLNDGDNDLSKEDALYLLKYGKSNLIKASTYLGNSAVAFESHNIANTFEWDSGESKFSISPSAGKKLLLKGSKILMDRNLITDDSMYFRVYAGPSLLSETIYANLEQLMLGAEEIFTSPQVGDILTTGAPELLHVKYKYEEPIPLLSSYGMRLEIGFSNNKPPKRDGSILKIRINAVSVKE